MSQKTPSFSPERLHSILLQLPSSPAYWVGFSGGADSTALLFALHELRTQLHTDIKAVHVNHGLHPEARDWEAHCKEICEMLGIELLTRRVHIDRNSGSGLEAEARHQRYAIIEKVLGEGDTFLTAHHKDDQAETLLLNLVRGSGVDGLAGMPLIRELGHGLLARPLLEFPMQTLRQFLLDRGLHWLEDPSNQDQSHDRNYVRQHLIPEIENRWPGVSGRIARSARHCRDASQLLEKWADKRLAGCLPHKNVLDITSLDGDETGFSFLVRHWLRVNRAAPIPVKTLDALKKQAQNASSQNHVCVEWDGWVIHQFRNHLWLQALDSISDCPEMQWSEPAPLNLGPPVGILELQPSTDLPPGPIHVRGRKGGEQIHTRDGGYHKQVKDILREAGIPPWLRPSIPLLCAGEHVLAVGDFVISTRLDDWLKKTRSSLSWRPLDTVLRFVYRQCHDEAVDHTETLG